MLSYYMHRDSLTGLWDKSFAKEETQRLSEKDGYGAILVRLIGADNMPLYIAEDNIKRTGRLISNITFNPVARIEYGDFIVFSNNFKQEADKIFDFLKEFRKEEFCHGVSAMAIEKGVTFIDLHRHLSAGISLSQLTGNKKAVY